MPLLMQNKTNVVNICVAVGSHRKFPARRAALWRRMAELGQVQVCGGGGRGWVTGQLWVVKPPLTRYVSRLLHMARTKSNNNYLHIPFLPACASLQGNTHMPFQTNSAKGTDHFSQT
ncbi:hypothetical protein KIL84_002947 [Mauremys mutica]|uniref:Uncharacterized protein n=1 Tax=Mauremys mutica TaxID=74926 RepID=A0A9D3WSY2_9SAUR|nr:hypothetical protein KIL84_002947 [Mauremys mutica]